MYHANIPPWCFIVAIKLNDAKYFIVVKSNNPTVNDSPIDVPVKKHNLCLHLKII